MSARTGRPWGRLRDRIIRRDQGRCHLCDRTGADSADHIVPVSLGGAVYDPSNLAAAHHNVWPHCNLVRGARPIEEARAEIAARIARADAEPKGWQW